MNLRLFSAGLRRLKTQLEADGLDPIAVIAGWVYPGEDVRDKMSTVYNWMRGDYYPAKGSQVATILRESALAGYDGIMQVYAEAAAENATTNGTTLDELRDGASATGRLADLGIDVSQMVSEQTLRTVEEIGMDYVDAGTRLMREAARRRDELEREAVIQGDGDSSARIPTI